MRKIVRIFNIDINLDRYRIGGEYVYQIILETDSIIKNIEE